MMRHNLKIHISINILVEGEIVNSSFQFHPLELN